MKARKAFEAEGIDHAVMRSRRGSAVRALQRARPATPQDGGVTDQVFRSAGYGLFLAAPPALSYLFSSLRKLLSRTRCPGVKRLNISEFASLHVLKAIQ